MTVTDLKETLSESDQFMFLQQQNKTIVGSFMGMFCL